jgi:hypothetical protein
VPRHRRTPTGNPAGAGAADLCRAGGAVDLAATRPPRPEINLVILADEPVDTDGPVHVDEPVDTDESIDADDAGEAGKPAGPAASDAPAPRRTGGLGAVFGPTGVRLQDDSIRTLRCGPDLFALIVDSLGVPLDMGRHIRLANTAQRRAIAARDGACVFPGCTLPPNWCDMHHVKEFKLGGEANVNELAPLCRIHHGVTHRDGWHMFVHADGYFWWQTPTGRTFWSQRHGRQRAGPAPPPRE